MTTNFMLDGKKLEVYKTSQCNNKEYIYIYITFDSKQTVSEQTMFEPQTNDTHRLIG